MVAFGLGILGLAVLIALVGGVGWLIYRAVRPSEQGADDTTTRSRATLLRFALVGGIGLVMLVPLGLVDGLVAERASLQQQAITGITKPWGEAQVVAGPVLVVPVERVKTMSRSTETDGEITQRQTRQVVDDSLIILPSSLTMKAALDHQERARGLYKAVVYEATVDLEASFDLGEARRFVAGDEGLTVHWDRASLAVGLSDPRSLRRLDPLSWDGGQALFRPGSNAVKVLGSGFHAPAPLPTDSLDTKPRAVAIAFTVNGSSRFAAVPVGETSTIALTSSWPHPSFQGANLPGTRIVTPDGFSATWTVPSLARDFPQVGLASAWDKPVDSFQVGAALFEPVSLYTAVERAIKYGVLFIALTYALFLALEVATPDHRLHPVQYLLVGLSMATFYLTLLALAEHLSFAVAYAVAGLVSAGMIGAYVASALRSPIRGTAVGAVQAALYAVLFVVLHLEDYALLVGTALVLVVLAVLMAVTRRLANP